MRSPAVKHACQSFLFFFFVLATLQNCGSSGGGETKAAVSETTPPLPTTDAPAFSPVAGSFLTAQNVTITTTTAGATICYTINLSSPSCNTAKTGCDSGTKYTAPVPISKDTTLKAAACLSGNSDSTQTTGGYLFDTTPPGPVTGLTATAYNGKVKLQWTNPTDPDLAGIKIMRKTGSYPTDENDGTVAYYGVVVTSVDDNALTDGVQYYYSAYAYDGTSPSNYSSAVQITATPGVPSIVTANPANNATGVAVCTGSGPCTAKVVLQFSEAMTATAPSLTAEIASGVTYVATPVSVVSAWSTTVDPNDTLTLTFSWYWFPENSKIRFTIPQADLKDAGSTQIAAALVHEFTTGSAGRNFSLADTGQSACYNDSGTIACNDSSFPRQDADSANIPAARSFTGPSASGSDYTTTDNVTALVWKSCTEGQSGANCQASGTAATNYGAESVKLTWNDAVNQCAALNTANSGAGYANIKTWRLPTAAELQSIADYGNSGPAIEITKFPATVIEYPNPSPPPPTLPGSYWSSSAQYNFTQNAWDVYFYTGSTGVSSGKATQQYVRCVSGGVPATASFFTNNGDGTVTDSKTGLMWQQCSVGQSGTNCSTGTATQQTWAAALNACKNSNAASKTWRLPSLNELTSIVKGNSQSPAIDATPFPATLSNNYWTSTTLTGGDANAWRLKFITGVADFKDKTDSATYARCVTGP